MGCKVNWHFHNPVKITVGRGCRAQLIDQVFKEQLLIVTSQRGRSQLTQDNHLNKLLTNNDVIWIDDVKENPGFTDLKNTIDQLQGTTINTIVAFGGGSVIDAAKVIRLGITLGKKYGFAELLQNSTLHINAPQPLLYALPTTSGTGSEVTPFATVWHHEVKKKLSLGSEQVFPTAAYVDADLIDSVPTGVTLSTGLDTINQAAESIWNKSANAITLAYATEALKLGFDALPKLISGIGTQQERECERERMAEASLLAGLAISHTRTALCHSISYPLTAHFGIPHGLACAFTMPAVCELNVAADDGRFARLAEQLFCVKNADIITKRFSLLNKQLRVREIVRQYIPCFDDLISLKSEMFTKERASNNLAPLHSHELERILAKSWG